MLFAVRAGRTEVVVRGEPLTLGVPTLGEDSVTERALVDAAELDWCAFPFTLEERTLATSESSWTRSWRSRPTLRRGELRAEKEDETGRS